MISMMDNDGLEAAELTWKLDACFGTRILDGEKDTFVEVIYRYVS